MRLFIEPTEPLLFRKGLPFNAGENNFAESLFPPTPETMQGALRAMLAVQWEKATPNRARNARSLFLEDRVVELIGERSEYGRFRITEFTLGRRNTRTNQVERLFPTPSHIIEAEVRESWEEPTNEIIPLVPERSSQNIISNHPAEAQFLFPDLGNKKTVGKAESLKGWLTAQGLQLVLSKKGLPRKEMQRENKKQYILEEEDIYKREARQGIRINNKAKTTDEGYLYQIQMIRMQQHCGFVVDIEFGEKDYGKKTTPLSTEEEQKREAARRQEVPPEIAALHDGWMTLGGEQRVARFTVLQPEEIAAEQGISRTGKGNLLYFATPAYFKGGWLPTTEGILPASPIAAAIERYQSIGGWQLIPGNAGGASKLTRRCIPAGSVYYFDGEISVSQPVTEYGWQIGYGLTYTGVYK